MSQTHLQMAKKSTGYKNTISGPIWKGGESGQREREKTERRVRKTGSKSWDAKDVEAKTSQLPRGGGKKESSFKWRAIIKVG